MARQNTIEIIINAKDNASGVFNNITGNLQSIGTVALGAVTAGLAAAGVAVGAFATQSLNAFTSFEQGISEVFTLLPGITADAMEAMESDVQSFMVSTGRLSEETLPALYQALSAGVPQDNVFEFLELANKAAIGGVTDLETAVDGITSVINAYGSDVLSATQASDLMFTAVRLGKTTFEELSASLFNVVPVASAVGVGFEDITAALATITAQGVPTSVATTQLRQLFVELSDAGTDVGEVFEQIAGQSFTAFMEAGNDTGDALRLLTDYAEEAGIPIQQLFGSVEAGQAVLALTSGNMAVFNSNLEAMGNASGATETAFDQMNDTLQFSINLLRSRFQSVLISTGRILAPFLIPLVDTFSLLLVIFEDGVRQGENLNDAIMSLIPPLRPLGFLIGNIGARLFNAAEGFSIMINAIKEGFDPLESFGYFLRRAIGNETGFAIQFLIGDIFSLFNMISDFLAPLRDWLASWIGIRDVMVAFGVAIGAVIIPAVLSFAAALAVPLAIFGALVAGVAVLRNAWENNFLGMRDIVGNAWERIQDIFNSIRSAFTMFFQLFDFGVPAFEAFKLALASIIGLETVAKINNVIAAFGNLVNSVKEFGVGLWSAFQEGGFSGAGNFVMDNLITPLIENLTTGFQSIDWSNVASTLFNLWGAALNAYVQGELWIFNNIVLPVANKLVEVIGSVDWNAVGSALMDALGAAIGLAVDFGVWLNENLFTPLVNNAQSAIGSVDWSAVGNAILAGIGAGLIIAWQGVAWVYDNFIAPLLTNAGAAIQSTDWLQVGSDILNAIGSALVSAFNFTVWLVDNVLSFLISSAQSGIESIDWFSVGEGIVNAIGAALVATYNFAEWIAQKIFSPITDNTDEATGQVDWSGVGDSIMSAIGAVLGAAWDFVTWLGETIITPMITGAASAIANADWSTIGSNIMSAIGAAFPNVAQWAQTNIIAPITNAASGINLGNIITGIGNVLAPGGASQGAPVPRQFGGRLKAFQPALVGESGRELFIPSTSGTVVNNQDTEAAISSGSKGNVTINFNYSGDITQTDAKRMSKMIVNELAALGISVSG